MGILGEKVRAAFRGIQQDAQDNCGGDPGTQLVLSMARQEHSDLELRDVEFRNNSQNSKGGIPRYLFSHGSRRAAELCAGEGIHSDPANLVTYSDYLGRQKNG